MRRALVWLNGGCVVGVLAAGLTAVLLFEEERPYPEAWDPRVLPLAQFVERERGHPFEHPVFVDFLTPAEFSERSRTDEDSLETEELEELKQAEALLRAFGLITDDVELLDQVNELSDTGTLAYYDSHEERVTVRGTELTPDLQATLVHELTHALQDQTFDLDRFDDDEEVTDGQLTAFTALVEGDADRIEFRYVESLGEAEEEEDEEIAPGPESEGREQEAARASRALAALFAVPYLLGDPFVDLLETVGRARIDEAFRNPPTTDEQVLDAFAYLDGNRPRAVAAPAVHGLEVLHEGDFGAVTLLVVLAERIDRRQALAAATGWGGDAYAVFERDGRMCARVDVSGDTPADTDELDTALRAWAGAAPSGTAAVTRKGDLVELESCDPGSRATAGSGGSIEALALASARNQLAVQALDGGFEQSEARCFAATLVNEVDPSEIHAELPSQRSLRTAAQIAQRCRTG